MSNELPANLAATSKGAYVPKTGWRPWAAAAVVMIILAVAVIVADIVRTLATVLGIDDRNWLTTIALLASQIVGIGLTLVASGLLSGRRTEVLALAPPAQGSRAYGLAFATMLVLFGVFSAVTWALNPEAATQDLSVFAGLLRSDAWWLALIAIGLGAPLMEELVFRGFLFSALAQGRPGIAGASVLTAAAWTTLHAGYSLVGLVEVFAVGLYFSWVLWRTGSLRVPIFCHSAYNLSVVAFLMAVDIGLAAPA